MLGRWSPPQELSALSSQLPRTVRQIWGPDPLQSRTHFLAPDISLGSVRWHLHLPRAGTFSLAARVRCPTPADDSFIVRIFSAAGKALLPRTDWHLGTRADWSRVDLTEPNSRQPRGIDLPAGEVTVEILPREDGAMLDQLELTPVSAPPGR